MENMLAQNILEIEDLKKDYGGNEVLKGLDLTIPTGKIVGLLGSNGAGKTTLLTILAGLMKSYTGKVSICGQKPGSVTKNYVAYLPDKGFLPENKAVSDLIDLYDRFFDDFDREKCLNLLERFGIEASKTPGEMSLGTCEKVQIALTMARSAKLYILDEPLGAIDVEARDVVIDAILDSFDGDASMIITTHLIREVEKLLDDVCVIKDGKAALYRGCDEIRAEYGAGLEDAVKAIFRGEYEGI